MKYEIITNDRIAMLKLFVFVRLFSSFGKFEEIYLKKDPKEKCFLVNYEVK